MEIYKIYENVLSELRKGHRPRLQLSNQQYEHIINELSELKELKVNLCLACHLRNPSPVFQPVLLKLLEENNNQLNELIPFIVEACTRHFIEYQHQYGEPVPPRFFKALAVFLGRCPKTLLSYQTKKRKYSGVLDCLRKTPNRQLYRGLSVGLAMHIPWNSIQLTSFSYFKDKLDNYSYISPYVGKMLCGAAAGVTSITMVYPTDLIRRRMQIQGFDPSVPKYNTPTHAVKSIIKTEGFKGLYKGLWTNYPKTLATFSIQYLVLDTLNSHFK